MQPTSEPVKKKSHWKIRIFIVFVIFPIVLFMGYTWLSLQFVYSSGERAGYLQKFSKRGWIFKTWEGELSIVNLPGAVPEIFHFTVRNEAVAKEVERLIGQRAIVFYNQHRGIPLRIFGDTPYFVQTAKFAEAQAPFQVNLLSQPAAVSQQ